MQPSVETESTLGEVEPSSSAAAANDKEAKARDMIRDEELVLDITGKSLEFDVLEKADDSVEALYLYKNAFSLFPSSIGMLRKLRSLKFFGNKLNLFPEEFGNLVELEQLQVKVSSPGLDALGFNKLKGLKELELSKAPPRPSIITILNEIVGLKCLTKLSVCHFSIRYLPPEIGCLYNLEYLDLSFNKIKKLPAEISKLNALTSLKVANNKLVELPSSLSALQRLENLDLSNNRLTSVGSLQLCSMKNLQYLNLQYNKLLDCCVVPPWISCNWEGNGKNIPDDDLDSCSVEMDVYETSIQSEGENASSNGMVDPLCLINGSSSNSRCFASRRSTKRWKRRYYMQQRARQERLNNIRKWKGEGRVEVLAQKGSEYCKSGEPVLSSEACEGVSNPIVLDDDDNIKEVFSSKDENSLTGAEDEQGSSKDSVHMENCSCDFGSIEKDTEEESCVHDHHFVSAQKINGNEDKGLSSEKLKDVFKSKRHFDGDLDNPKPGKCQKPTGDCSSLCRKYRDLSFCGIDDRLTDGFYDAGRNRPFLPLSSYEQILPLDSREVILLDREKDEKLDATVLSAKALVSRLKRFHVLDKEGSMVSVDNLHIVSLLALFVSDHFGGSDKSFTVRRTRKAVSGSNYDKPFVCTCSTGNGKELSASKNQISDITEHNMLSDLCEKSLHSVKARRNSIVVPLGNLQFGVCRHRALLMKYLCDRMEPPIPCELVRGYLDFTPHAWNSILIKKGDSWVRMLVDACRPLDIREETDAEYFCRYIPLSRTRVPLSNESIPGPGLSTSFAHCDELEKTASSTVVRCKLGSLDAVAKVRSLETCGNSMEEIKNFEYSCIGEVRILGALQHSCIVEMYGHQISSKWILSEDGKPQQQILRSAIIMEHVKGGSLKKYIEKMSENGEQIAMDLALCIAQDVACALAELHSRHIIHRDVKSENVLIDLDCDGNGGTPVVKLTDFDRAVPLRSYLHTCCVGHKGIPPPDVCVGTPRWMAPEVFRAMHERHRYGLEVDIWSYGCLLLELLTLQVPYYGVSESYINELLQSGKRPPLPDELKALISKNEPADSKSVSNGSRPEAEQESLKFLVDLFHRCTEGNPASRPKAAEICDLLASHRSNFSAPSRVDSVGD